MPRGVGRALLAAVKSQAKPRVVSRGTPFGNPHRRRLFQYLGLHPCGSLSEAAKALGLSPATIRFHALRLADANYVVATRRGFYPVGLIDPDETSLFEAFSTSSMRRVLAAVYEHPGRALSELAGTLGMTRQTVAALLDHFDSHGLVTRVADGKFVRVYPTRVLEEKSAQQAVRGKQFVDDILRRLEAEGEDPEVLRRTSEACVVRLGRGPKSVLELHLEPYASLLL